jgi:hypothetical protein
MKQKSYKKRNAGSFIGIFIVTVILGFVFGLIGIVIGAAIVKGINGLAGALIGLIIGYPLGVIIGLALMRASRHYGSLGLGVLGSVLGAILVILAEELLHLDLDPIILFGTFFIIIPLLCLIGFYLKKMPSQTPKEAN